MWYIVCTTVLERVKACLFNQIRIVALIPTLSRNQYSASEWNSIYPLLPRIPVHKSNHDVDTHLADLTSPKNL